MAKIEQLIGVTVENGEKFYRDKSMNAGTRALFDLSVKWPGGGVDVAAGSQFKSLGYENSIASVNKAHVYQDGGLVWAGVAGDQFLLPSEFLPLETDASWLYTFWMKVSNAGSTGFNNQLFHIGGAYNATANVIVSLVPTVDAAGAVTNLELKVMGQRVVVTTQLAALTDGSTRQIGVGFSKSEDGTTFKIKAWLDTELVYESAYLSLLAFSADTSQRFIGTSSSLPKSFTGSVSRARFDVISASGPTPEEILKADYDSSVERLA